MGRYNTSDSLAIALTCLAAVMALVLFWIDKTPFTAGLCIVAMAALLIYPVIHFVPSSRPRIVVFVVLAATLATFGWSIWPKRKTVLAGRFPGAPLQTSAQPSPQSQSPINPAPNKIRTRSSNPPKPREIATVDPPPLPPQQTASGGNNGQVGGGVTTGDCSNVQIGGSNNQATTNCVRPASPNVQLITVYKNKSHTYVPDDPNQKPMEGFESRYRVRVTGQTVPQLDVTAVNPSFIHIDCVDMSPGLHNGVGGAGNGHVGCSLENIHGDTNTVIIFTTKPLPDQGAVLYKCVDIVCNYLKRPEPDPE